MTTYLAALHRGLWHRLVGDPTSHLCPKFVQPAEVFLSYLELVLLVLHPTTLALQY